MPKCTYLYIYVCLFLTFSCKQSKSGKQHPEALQQPLNSHAMVVSAHREASEAGIKMLEKGGNAVDAAIAVQYALAVVLPAAGNLGGGGFMVYRDKDGTCATLDYREKAPSLAFRDMYLDSLKNVIPNLSLNGHLASGVPGTVAGIFEAHRKYGKLAMKDLIQPAIDLAENGFVLTEKDCISLNSNRENFKKYNTESNPFSVKDTFIKGELFIQKDLANTLKRIQKDGENGFYQGQTAQFILAEMQRGKGIISASDLTNYKAIWREPLYGKYKNYDLVSMPPPSSGGIALFQLLQMLEKKDIKKEDWHKVDETHLIVEAEKRVYADRAKHLGDKDFYPVPVKGLINAKYLESRMKDFSASIASPSASISAGNPAPYEHEETTHLSVVDKDGNAVAVTTTLNGSFGSSVVVGGAGFLLNNEMDDFAVKPGVPNYYGLVGAEANAVQANKRMLSSMTPTILSKNGKLFMVVGTPGGSTIITSVFQTIVNVIDHQFDMQAAVAAPRFHHQWLPDKIMYEKGCFSPEVISELQTKGHILEERKGPSGRVDAILVRANGTLEGGADPRGDDTAIGIE